MLRAPHRAATVLAAASAAATLLGGCSGGDGDPVAASSSATAAALSSAAVASPGAYGTPSNPTLPNPTDVASDPAQPTAAGPDGVTVVVTYATWVADDDAVEVGAFVQGVVETGGECTLVITGSGGRTTTSGGAEADAGSTSCGELRIAGGDLEAGQYTAVVSYNSSAAAGTSDPATVVVP